MTEVVRKMAYASALPAAQEVEPLFCWDLTRVDFGQRKLLVASNAATRLCAITRMAAADWKHIDEVALRLVEGAIVSAGLDAERYLELAGGVSLSKTHGRRAMGFMNDLTRMLDPACIDMGEKLQWHEMEHYNCRFFTKSICHEDYGIPAERFAKDLQALLERLSGNLLQGDARMVNTRSIPVTFAPAEPSAESLEAIHEGNIFLASGKEGRFTSGADLIASAMV